MKLPNLLLKQLNLFYAEEIYVPTHTTDPDGELDVTAMLNRPDCWKIMRPADFKMEKKKLVINDWRLPYSGDLRQCVYDFIFAQLKDGFEIYYVKEDRLVRVIDSVILRDVINHAGYPPDKIIDMAANENISPNQLQISGYFMNNLLKDNVVDTPFSTLMLRDLFETPPNLIDLAIQQIAVRKNINLVLAPVFWKSKAEDEMEIFSKLLEKIRHNITKIWLCDDLSDAMMNMILENDLINLIAIDCNVQLKKGFLLFNKYANQLKEVSFLGVNRKRIIELSQAPLALESLEIEGAIDWSDLTYLLDGSLNLKTLKAEESERTDSCDQALFKQINPNSHLEFLELKGFMMSFANLMARLNSCSNLKALRIIACDQFTDEVLFNPFIPNTHLETIQLSKSTISYANLAAWLNSCPNLKTLRINHCNGLMDEVLVSPLISNTHLESLKLKELDMSYPNLAALVNSCPNLKVLEIIGFALPDEFLLSSFTLNKCLESLKLNGLKCTSLSLAHILNLYPNLKQLMFSIDDQLEAEELFNKVILNSCLEYLEIDTLVFSFIGLAQLLKVYPNLKMLQISGSNSKLASEALFNPFTSNNHLESLHFVNMDIALPTLVSLLNMCPDLKELQIETVKDNGSELIGEVLSGADSHLEFLSLKSVKITFANLVSLLNICPDLKTLKIEGKGVLMPRVLLSPITLHRHLESLCFVNAANMIDTALAHMLNAFPNLKTLDIKGCSGLACTIFRDESFQLTMLETITMPPRTILNDLVFLLNTNLKLTTLKLDECDKLTLDDIEYLIRNYPQLKNISFVSDGLSGEVKNGLQQLNPDLRINYWVNSKKKINQQKKNKSAPRRLDNDLTTRQHYNLQEYFLPKSSGFPRPLDYWLQIFDQLCTVNNDVFLTKKQIPLTWMKTINAVNSLTLREIYQQQYHQFKNVFYGEMTLSLPDDTQKIPSLNFDDKLLYFQATGKVDMYWGAGFFFVKINPAEAAQHVNISYIIQSIPRNYSLLDLLLISHVLQPTEVSKLPGQSMFAYAILKNELYYIDKYRGSCTRMNNINEHQINSLKEGLGIKDNHLAMNETSKCLIEKLSIEQLKCIKQITGHGVYIDFLTAQQQKDKIVQLFKKLAKEGMIQFDRKLQLVPHHIFDFLRGKYFLTMLVVHEFFKFPDDDKKTPLKDTKSISGVPLLNAIIREQKGACRQRAMAALGIMIQLEIQARVISNDCHDRLVIWDNEGIAPMILDFGGYPAGSLIVKPMRQPANKKPEELLTKSISKTSTTTRHRPPRAQRPIYHSFDDYCNWLMNEMTSSPAKRKVLIEFESAEQIIRFHVAWGHYLSRNKKQFFYLARPGEIIRRAPQILDSALMITDGPLFTYLQQSNEQDFLVINYSHYDATMIALNSITDDSQSFEGVPVPHRIIGYLQKEDRGKVGKDLLTRFDLRDIFSAPLPANMPYPQLQTDSVTNTALYPINLYGGDDWQKDLSGAINIEGECFTLVKGALVNAIEQEYPGIEIQNAPWQVSEFRLFIADFLAQKRIWHNGVFLPFPDDFMLLRSSRNDQFEGRYFISQADTDSSEVWQDVLNPTFYSCFFQTYQFHHEQAHLKIGWLEENSHKLLSVYVTATFSVGQWARLIDEAQKHQCQLHFILAPQFTVPEVMMNKAAHLRSPAKKRKTEETAKVTLICSNDLDLAQRQLRQEDQEFDSYILSNITSETRFSDLIERVRPEEDPQTHIFKFHYQLGDIGKCILEGEVVVLKGTIAPQLASKFETLFASTPYLWVNGEKKFLKGRLLLLIDNAHLFPWVKNKRSLQYSKEDSFKAFTEEFGSQQAIALQDVCKALQINLSYIQLKSLSISLNLGHSLSQAFKLLLGLRGDYQTIVEKIKQYQAKHPQVFCTSPIKRELNSQLVDLFSTNAKRLKKIDDYLANSPYVFIAGRTGAGKSSLVFQDLPLYYKKLGRPVKMYKGMEQKADWLNHSGENESLVLWVLDEINLYQGDLSFMEGVFNSRPCMLDGKGALVPLKSFHKIICMGNFAHYSGRKSHAFFERHGGIIVFNQLPDPYLYDKILIPMLEEILSGFKVGIAEIAHLLLKSYRAICEHPGVDVERCTPRNLQMVCMRLAVSLQNEGIKDCIEKKDLDQIPILVHIAFYEEMKGLIRNKADRRQYKAEHQLNLVRQEYKHAKKSFFNITDSAFYPYRKKFVLTHSREASLLALADHLAIRALRRKHPALDAKCVRGLLLEGPAATAKTVSINTYLESRGFVNAKNSDKNNPGRYYYLSSNSLQEMEKGLIAASSEGAIAVIDEFNALPLEAIINKVLDQNSCPGFLIIAAQNPLSYGNRKPLSPALLSRFQPVEIKDYPKQELVKILTQSFDLRQEIAEHYVEQHYQKKLDAELWNESAPTFRELQRRVNNDMEMGKF